MLFHEALDKTLKYCRISAAELTKITGISSSRISQFRNGLFLEGKGSDLTTRALNELINAAEEIDPKAKRVFALYLTDQDPDLAKKNSSLLNPAQIESMDATQISHLLIAIADTLDKSKRQGAFSVERKSENPELVDVLNAS
jgi:DNA-binding Xre family transcriptional regulator